MAKNDEYVLSFEVTNLGTDQDSPAVLIQANTLPIPVAPMDKDPGVLVGVDGGRAPLKIVVPVRTTQTPRRPRMETPQPPPALPDC